MQVETAYTQAVAGRSIALAPVGTPYTQWAHRYARHVERRDQRIGQIVARRFPLRRGRRQYERLSRSDGDPVAAHLDIDAMSIATQTDALLLVVDVNTVRRETLAEARRVLDSCPARALGLVATGWNGAGTHEYRRNGYRRVKADA